ncbi:MAG: ATP-dependent sacrificial sulfur transferase LarE [Chitinispirillaceae bacterium]|nr:ATP-dependent sacrificial sulfur transferase LarE [Chitinispirillaceae bacterium]
MEKSNILRKIIEGYDSALIAFSGGVDSTFLAKAAAEVLGERLLLVTATSCTYPESELADAQRLAGQLGVRHRVVVSEEITLPGFAQNTPDRCYHCKHELFSLMRNIAKEEKLAAVFEGSTVDDLSDYRPGRRALKELGIISPLLEAGLTKNEIRSLSAALHLETAVKPSYACLASRFPYGETITREKLSRVGAAEEEVKRLGFRQMRIRSHDNLARIEVAPEEMETAWNLREKIDAACRGAGFVYTALDLRGYRTGAMNEALSDRVTGANNRVEP